MKLILWMGWWNTQSWRRNNYNIESKVGKNCSHLSTRAVKVANVGWINFDWITIIAIECCLFRPAFVCWPTRKLVKILLILNFQMFCNFWGILTWPIQDDRMNMTETCVTWLRNSQWQTLTWWISQVANQQKKTFWLFLSCFIIF